MMAHDWDLFCRVIDNFGDVGVCWRLARDLARRGQRVRLWIDDARALSWMAGSERVEGVSVLDWQEAATSFRPGRVVIEAFGCELPAAVLSAMALASHPPLWLNLEYLSAESYVERSHGLQSPQFSGPAAGLDKRFFYPGFSRRTGGLLREPDLLQRQANFDAAAWLAAHGCSAQPGERIVSLFCYDNPALLGLIEQLGQVRTLLLVCPGPAARAIADTGFRERMSASARSNLRIISLPFLDQLDFDHLLWASDLNFVRGEDSFVRAQWAAKPMVWQIYPQDDGAHGPKLQAFLQLWLQDADDELRADYQRLWLSWNGLMEFVDVALPDMDSAQMHALHWRAQLAAQQDLCSQILGLLGETS
ncbi:elongation factor P maturation arginine rhamnosyltransferase EarP [Paucibacter sp. APW11]|uniref:Protein-arginine rhamnosyltransferase n=1 Tax=Roseateles aquae TaxID=3077235 RepID=A0ABU3P7I5_9BURK|nr:elongation factor P maturation arginine rhamnosyltransferase EarP [Paucibacter sp. APW11]MDT8998063.1 elongation factor P maturation arginine rhamnosyltransferase EarP [Paucibacter sp. APW11]